MLRWPQLLNVNRATIAAAVAVAFALLIPTANAQLPVAGLNGISPAGAKAGSELEVKISGTSLDEAQKLLFSHDGITATPKMEPAGEFSKQERPVENTFIVKVAGNVPAGLYEVRAVGCYAMTNPRTFHVSTFEEVNDASGNTSMDKAYDVATGSIVNNQADSDNIDYYRIAAKKGERLLIDCWAQRIDSRMDPSLVLYNSAGQELRRVHNTSGLDPVMELNVPADGNYVIGVYDFTYGGGSDYFYRLAVHQGPYIDFIFPPVGQAGTNGKFTIYGRNLPGGKPVSDMSVGGSPLEQVEVNIQLPGDENAKHGLGLSTYTRPYEAVVGTTSYQLKSPAGPSNAVDIGFASAPLVLEAESNDDSSQPQNIDVPCEFVGQFYPRGDRDWVQFEAKQGEVFWIDVLSHRLGLPTDPVLIVEQVTTNSEGEVTVSQVATNDDFNPPQNSNTPQMFSTNNRDPRYRFEAKADATYRIGLGDLYTDSRGDPRMVYRMVIRKAMPDFQVLVFNEGNVPANNQYQAAGAALRRGETAGLQVVVVRRDGFDGDVTINAEGLPQGVTCGQAIIGGKSKSAKLLFTADANANAWAGAIRVYGTAKIDGKDVRRDAHTGALIWGSKNVQQEIPIARMTRDVGLSIIDKETVPATVTAGDGNVVETSVGGKIEVPIKVAQHGGFKASIKLKATNIPAQTQAKDADVGTEGKMEISFANNRVEPGSYTIYLAGPAKFKYEGNQDAVKAAEERQKELDQILKDPTEQAKQAAEKAKQARDAANKNKEDKGLADAAAKAEEASKAMEEKRKKAESLKKKADQDLNNAKNANKPKDVNYNVVSTPVLVRIAPTPLVLSAQSPAAKKQGETIELPVTVERKFGCEDEVELSFEPPRGVAGVSAAKVKVPKGQNQGKLEIKLNDSATVGEHEFVLRGRVRFNNVQLDETLPVALKIEAKPEEKK